MALHWPVMEKGDDPARPIFPVRRLRFAIALTVSVPLVLWLTPMVQPIKADSACP